MYAQTVFEQMDIPIEQAKLPIGCLTKATLRRQSVAFRGTGGISEENGSCGFAPAFQDSETGMVYRACFADGRPAPMHLLEGLPPCVVAQRDATGKVCATKPSLVAGFVRCGRFYTREQAAAAALN